MCEVAEKMKTWNAWEEEKTSSVVLFEVEDENLDTHDRRHKKFARILPSSCCL